MITLCFFNTKLYPQLLWTSLGNPKLVKRKSIINDSLELFHFTPEEIYMHIEMLTEEHKQLLVDLASKKYSHKIDSSQIINLILSKFECSLKFFDGKNTISLYGKVTQFRKFPLRLDILAPETAIERKLLLDRLNDSLNIDLVLNCELATETNRFSRQLSLYTVETSEESNEIQKIYSLVNMVNTEFDAFKTQFEKQYSLVNSKFLLIKHEAENYHFEVNSRLSEIESKIHKEFTILQGRDMIQFDENFLQVLENLGSRKVSRCINFSKIFLTVPKVVLNIFDFDILMDRNVHYRVDTLFVKTDSFCYDAWTSDESKINRLNFEWTAFG
jgi:hypothetical protein